MPKFKVDLDKDLFEQSWAHKLKPGMKNEAIKLWKKIGLKVEEEIANGNMVIDPTIPKRNMIVTIPDNQLTEEDK